MNFLLEGPFGGFEQNPGGYNYWVFVTIWYYQN